MTSIAVSIVGLVLAYLVYSLNTEKFYSELITRRYDAYVSWGKAMDERENDGRRTVRSGPVDNYAAQIKYWRASDEMRALFGGEVIEGIEAVDEAYLAWLNTLDSLQSNASREKNEAHAQSLSNLYDAREEVTQRVRPYIRLGQRGLPLRQRIAILRARSDRKKLNLRSKKT